GLGGVVDLHRDRRAGGGGAALVGQSGQRGERGVDRTLRHRRARRTDRGGTLVAPSAPAAARGGQKGGESDCGSKGTHAHHGSKSHLCYSGADLSGWSPEGYMSRRAAIRASSRAAPSSASSGDEIHRWAVAREAGIEAGPARRSFSRAAASPGG